jgi:hypothetical protein
MELLDRIFQIVFARYRRRVGDSNLDSTWRRASNKVTGYLVFPLASISVVATLATYAVFRTGTGADHKQWSRIISIGTVLAVGVLLDRRFQKYRIAPPVLTATETRQEARLFLIYRVAAIATLLSMGLIGLLVQGDDPLIKGF